MQQHLEKLRIALAIRRDIMEEQLAAAGWEWSSPEGGFNLWVKLPETVSIDRLLVESVKQSITFVPGSICDPLRSFSSWIRLSYSYLNEQQSREGLKRFVGLCRMLERWE